MKRIPLTQGKYALIDNEDFEKLNQFKWRACYQHGSWYAVREIRKAKGIWTTQKMHMFIMNTPKGMEIDHENHNGLDNQKTNLRICTHVQNLMNQRPQHRKTSSKHKGVYWHKCTNKWMARIKLNGKYIYLGLFVNEINAALAYDVAAKELFREFAYLNSGVRQP